MEFIDFALHVVFLISAVCTASGGTNYSIYKAKKGSSEHLPSTNPTQKIKSVVTWFPLTRVEEDTFGGGGGADGASSIDL